MSGSRKRAAPGLYYSDGDVAIYHGDCRKILPWLGPVDAAVTDPPYGETSLEWDRWVDGWTELLPSQVLWCFGSFRMFFERRDEFRAWKLAQEIVWEKHNGSGFHADRFKRVHELCAQFYKGEWSGVYRSPVTTDDATARTVRRKRRPPHTGNIGAAAYVSEDGGPRLMRSVIRARSCHGEAEHPTQKPLAILKPLLEYSVPPGGVVLDPFMGSGSTLRAAKDLGLRAIGIEADKRYCEIAVSRLAQGALFGGQRTVDGGSRLTAHGSPEERRA